MDPSGAAQPKLYLIGEAPGEKEDYSGTQFIGKSGKLLRQCLDKMSIDMAFVRINNAIRCAPRRPGKTKLGKPGVKDIASCWPSVLEDIAATQPTAIVTLGKVATSALLHTRAPISSIRGSVQSAEIAGRRFTVIPTFHPSFIERSEDEHGQLDTTTLTFFMRDLAAAWKYATEADVSTTDAKTDYRVLVTLEDIERYMQQAEAACDAGGYIVPDFETIGLRAYDQREDVLILSMSHAAHQAVAIPLNHHESPLRGCLAEIGQLLQPLSWLPVANHNVKFDYQWARHRLGIVFANMVMDTYLAHHCIWSGSRPNDLETMAGLYLKQPAWSYRLADPVAAARARIKTELKRAKKSGDTALLEQALAWKCLAGGKGYGVAPLAELCNYGCIDADVTWRLVPVVRALLEQHGLTDVYRNMYHASLPVFSAIQYHGIKIDRRECMRLERELPLKKKQIAEAVNRTMIARQTCEQLGKPAINLGSPQQVAALLYDGIGLPPATLPGKGPRTTEADQLERLIGWTKRGNKRQANQLLEHIKEWRTLDKYLGSYVESLLHFADPNDKVYPSWNLAGTDTGRFALQDPPIHSMPVGELRNQIVSRWEDIGGFLLAADESQIEVRVYASLADDRQMCWFYNEHPNADLHRYLASLLFNKPYDQVSKLERRIAKTCVFASLYGGGAGNLVAQTGMHPAQAKTVHGRFLSLLAVEDFKRVKIQEMNEHGYIGTPFGRRRYIKLGRTEQSYQHSVRQIINTPIQSTANDIVLTAINCASRRMLQAGLRSRIVLFHHDAIYWDVYPGELWQLLPLAQQVLVEEPMAHYRWLKVPLKIGVEIGRSWGQMFKLSSWDAEGLIVRTERDEQHTAPELHRQEVLAQFEGSLGRTLRLQTLQSSEDLVVDLVTAA